jgi:hypothetical protein
VSIRTRTLLSSRTLLKTTMTGQCIRQGNQPGMLVDYPALLSENDRITHSGHPNVNHPADRMVWPIGWM